MKISVIIPVYNVEPYIEKCLNSVMAQTYQGELECIIVDDCGIDNSMAVAEKTISDYSGPISFQIIHHDNNMGLSAARNTGMDAATGEYIFFLDSDDMLPENCMVLLTEPLKQEKYDIVAGNICVLDENGNSFPSRLGINTQDNKIIKGNQVLDSYLSLWFMLAQNKLYRNVFIQDNRLCFKEGIIHEDVLWSFEAGCVAKSMFLVKDITYYYLKRDSGITGKEKKWRNNSFITIVQEMGAFVEIRNICLKRAVLLVGSHFSHTLYDYVDSFSDYRDAYHKMRGAFNIPFRKYVGTVGMDMKWYFRDFHLFVPKFVAVYVLYLSHVVLSSLKHSNCKK